MRRFIKICVVTGLILLLLGLGVIAVSAAMRGRYTNSLPSRLASRVCHNHMPWLVRRDNDWQDNQDHWDDRDSWNGRDDSNNTDRASDSSQVDTVSNPPYTQARKLDVDIDKGIIHVSEKESISQIRVDVQGTYNRTQYYMGESTLKVKREPGRSRDNEVPRVEVLIPVRYELGKSLLDMGTTECTVLGVTISKLEIDAGVDATIFSGTINRDVEIGTGVGDVALNLTNSQIGYSHRVECGVGSANIGTEHYTMLSYKTHINNKAPYTMELECDIGNITASFDQTLQDSTEKEVEV